MLHTAVLQGKQGLNFMPEDGSFSYHCTSWSGLYQMLVHCGIPNSAVSYTAPETSQSAGYTSCNVYSIHSSCPLSGRGWFRIAFHDMRRPMGGDREGEKAASLARPLDCLRRFVYLCPRSHAPCSSPICSRLLPPSTGEIQLPPAAVVI